MFSKLKESRWAIFHFMLLFALLAFAVWFSDSRHPLRLKMQHAVFDQFNTMVPREPVERVVIVDIDEKSLEAVGQWPWPRNVMAALTRSLARKGAKVIAFDGVFAEEDRASPSYLMRKMSKAQQAVMAKDGRVPDYDALFAREIKNSKVFVTAFTYGRSDRTDNKPLNKNRVLAKSNVKDVFVRSASRFDGAAVNLPQFSKAAAGNGSFMAKPDADGILRRVGLIFSDGKALYPSLNLEALRIALLGRKGTVRLAAVPSESRGAIDTNFRIVVGEKTIPVEDDGIVYVHYRPFDQGDYVPAYKFLSSRFTEEATKAVKDKIVLIGASAEGLKDLRSTALAPFRPGVEVHANVIEQIMQDDYLLRPDITKGAEALFILLAGLFFILMAPFVGVIVSVMLCASIIGFASYGAYVAYVDHGLLIDPVYPSFAVLIIFVVSTILSYARAESRRKHIRTAFGMYVAPDVMRDLEKNPEKLKLGGENRDLTVMFTDIRKFTSISEGLSPEELIQLMNDFLTIMTDIVMEHQGTVDKYIGDAMMTFWNAPRDVRGHERQACLAALRMQSALEPLNKKVKERAIELDKEPILLQAGIGINTGPCAVGNMGSKQRFAYSALGDAVNLSSRLEGQTKAYGVNILVGESTYKKASDLAMLELDLVKVIGKEKPTRIYALFGDAEMAQSETFKMWEDMHNKMLAFYRDQEFSKANVMLENSSSYAGERAQSIYEMYRERLEYIKNVTLPKDWDGVFEAKNK